MKAKKIILFFLLLALTFSLLSCIKSGGSPFEIFILNTGKSDAIIILTQNHTLLIDTGYTENGSDIVGILKEKNRNIVDYMIITHFDKDHVGGAAKVLENIQVKNVLEPSYNENSKEYSEYKKALEKNSLLAVSPKEPLMFDFDSVVFTVYPPKKAEYDNENNFSLVTGVVYYKTSFLFTGDALAKRLNELLKDNISHYDFIKLPHHGSYNDKTKEFLKAVMPKYAVITDSKKEPADSDTVAALLNIGAKIYYTKDNTVKITSNGQKIKITQ